RETLSLADSRTSKAMCDMGAREAPREAPLAASAPLAGEIPLIGRTAELARLRPLVETIDHGRGRVLLLLGEAGVGKSRVMAELAAVAARQGHSVFLGRCYEAERILPFRPWVDALRCTDIAGAVTGLAALWRAELARLFPELAPEAVDPGGSSPDQSRLFEAVAQLLVRLCASRPLTVVLEAIHWADEMSLGSSASSAGPFEPTRS